MEKYIDPTSDLGFKLLFGREKISEPVLVDLLNALLCGREGFEEIKTVSYLNSERSSEWKDGKSIRYDILCETSSGHRFNFHVPALDRKPIVRACTLDEDTFQPIGVKTRYIFVQLPFFNKAEEECEDMDEKWIYNIKNMGIRQEVAFKSNSEIFKRLAEVANVATLTPEQRYHYEADVKNARDTLNQIRGAFMDGEQKGRAEEKKEIARKMLREGMGVSMVVSFTGLSESEIESLKEIE